MVLNNYRKFRVVEGMENNAVYYTTYKTITGAEQAGFKATNNTYNLRRFGASIPQLSLKMYVGTGTTPPTAEDYCLESPFTPSNYNYTFDTRYENGRLITDGIATGVNDTNSAITISEVGISRMGLLNSNSSNVEVLFVRHILDNPITVPSGESFRVTIEWIDE